MFAVDYSVCVLEKGAEVGAHILSGNVFEPRAMDELFPDWKTMDNGPPIETEVTEDVFLVLPDDTHSVASAWLTPLTSDTSVTITHPPSPRAGRGSARGHWWVR